MNPKELKELGYPSNITELIQEAEGVEVIEETDDFYLIHDTYNNEDRVLNINKTSEFKPSYFEFFQNNIDQEEIYAFARTLPSLLFMNLKKVYFVEKDEDLMGEVDEESPNNTFYFLDKRDPIGMSVYGDSVAFVNLRRLRELAHEEAQLDLRDLGYAKPWESYFLSSVCQTLAHELFHLTQFNPLIEELIPDGEEAAEEFCRYYN